MGTSIGEVFRTTFQAFRRSMIKLSVCIATYKRARYIGETLQSILMQLPSGVEIVVVDGASPDDTATVMARVLSEHSAVRYFREAINSGVDGDYDKAVSYAEGEYCWLMTDDDLLKPGAIAAVLSALSACTDRADLVIVNSEVRTADMSSVLRTRLLPMEEDRQYQPRDHEALLAETAGALSFIGGVVIRRELWLSRDRLLYYGSLFVHVGVIFQAASSINAHVIAEPLISIRYGNAMWTSRGFEIWMFKWPALIWSFTGFSDRAKSTVCLREPWRKFRKLWLYRAIGGYSLVEYHQFFTGELPLASRVLPRFAAALPRRLANAIASLYCLAFAREARMNIYDLANSANGTWVSRAVARAVGA